MQTMQPEQAAFFRDVMFYAVKNEQRVTKRIIEAIPLDRGDYQPDPVSKSAVELAWHIVASENRFFEAVIQGQFDLTGRPRPESIETSADVAKWYAETFEPNLNRLTQLSGEQLARMIDFRGLIQLPAVTFLRLGLSHSIHHRGQLSVYLRPMGAKVPSIYGESYDDAQARKAAQAQAPTA